MIRLELSGKPEGKGRPRFGQGGRVFTPTATKLAEGRVIDAWTNAGSPRLEGPIRLRLILNVARPKDHFTAANGVLSAKGKRTPRPSRKPDVDNALKLVMDALNGRAYRDDVDVTEATVIRQWSSNGWESSVITVESLAGSAPGVAA